MDPEGGEASQDSSGLRMEGLYHGARGSGGQGGAGQSPQPNRTQPDPGSCTSPIAPPSLCSLFLLPGAPLSPPPPLTAYTAPPPGSLSAPGGARSIPWVPQALCYTHPSTVPSGSLTPLPHTLHWTPSPCRLVPLKHLATGRGNSRRTATPSTACMPRQRLCERQSLL